MFSGSRTALLFLATCWPLALGACGQNPQPPFQAGVCFIDNGGGRYRPLDDGIDNLETCGARLEVVYLDRRRPVVGAFGGMYVLVDGGAIDSQAPNGPRAPLIDPGHRRQVDADIRLLQQARAHELARDVAPDPSPDGSQDR